MNILLLGERSLNLKSIVERESDNIIHTNDIIVLQDLINYRIGFIISYGYRLIVNKSIIKEYLNSAINLHISYLPWNRGADPNLWSILEDTKKGVSIHLIDEGIDTGDIITQRELFLDENDTLRSSYEKLSAEIEDLFAEKWMDIRSGDIKPVKQAGLGSYHYAKEKEKYMHLLYNGWDTPIKRLVGIVKE